MSEITTLQPQLLWKWFDQICAIPHPSHHEDELANFIVNWAKEKQFFVERDDAGNVLIRKPATAGMENRTPVALQAHLDMVPQANEDNPHNFTQDPIRPYIDGDWVKAQGTTLGADNGIGLASALAVLESDDVAHPPLEVLLTMTEETGMDGALNLRRNWLQSEILINTDTEEIGEIYIGCAGGINANLELPIERENNAFEHCLQLTLKGLRGGHSGCDIHTGRVNAIKLLARVLAKLSQNQPHFALAEIRGGSIRNAIPREAAAVLTFNGDLNALESAVRNLDVLLKEELAIAEPNLTLFVEPTAKAETVFTAQSTKTVIHLLNALPNGVIRNSDVIKNVVESSLSIGVLKTESDKVKGTILIRSLIESGKAYVTELLSSVATLAGAKTEFSAPYPGWKPVNDSAILNLTKKHYADVLGKDPEIKVIHAGLECGLLKEHYPHIDMVSLGPTIRNAHSPDEKVQISTVKTYWEVLVRVLGDISIK
ncbi:cytosol nonspecific dipeptidase [Rodentibacter caecimuris]|uniref:Cytosol non-specific dipeptidase n=1 Tax=Rodentibacter caecimuris TaxID=1796644 RepID=A0A9X8VXU5_9PAST|nr:MULTISPECIES: beta-Ala-His dipeptidase [Pasteurellaceae]AOF53187.1 Aminoacyl-histidine dipeptidase (Peptidase D) [Pasteurellaceae bacterium NI1060]MCR1836587.1 beta-Ala-His dipeptidase [Pasteurella caecimuris]MCU0106981.1 beta-Ala-His dipeptidase [Pasteurella caecimuris]OOF70454.1 cytosol nonspecific dipeptidase [Rodentibacter heylii]OOF76121.1 cytosol nonspecific dipeptidase [Rodentibacter heylii]